MSDTKISRKEFEASLRSLDSIVSQDGYYCLKGHEKNILKRKRNVPEVSKKIEIAKRVAKKLSRIPSILFIGISGGLAAGSAEAEDDIDFVVITKKDTLFTTRVMVLSILESLGVRRARTQRKTADTICLNLLFDETAISWFANHQDVYTAREIAQIVPLFERDDMYQRFFKANGWIKEFLPNVGREQEFEGARFNRNDMRRSMFQTAFFNPLIENVLRVLQMRWMRRQQTKEVITTSLLAFHPNDYRTHALKKLRLKTRQLGLLTKF